jgi:hypothetical protein
MGTTDRLGFNKLEEKEEEMSSNWFQMWINDVFGGLTVLPQQLIPAEQLQSQIGPAVAASIAITSVAAVSNGKGD